MRTLEQFAHLSVEVALKISCFKLDFAVLEALMDCCLEKNYNSCWPLHQAFSEPALIRLFQKQYVPEIPDSLVNFAKHPPGTVDIEELLADPSIQAHLKYYVQQVKKCLNGEFGKTPQFWVMYMIMVDWEQKLHYVINMNN